MRNRLALALLLALCALPLPARASELLRAIDAAFEAGTIDEGERQWLRVASVRAPSRLPEPWRSLGARGPATIERRCHTPLLAEAYQSIHKLDRERGEALRGLFAPPSDLDYMIETTTPFPMRVSYSSPQQQAQAEQLLAAAQRSYERIVDELGFWPPPIEPGLDFYRFYLMSAGGAAGYTAPYEENDATEHLDAFSYIVIDPSLDDLSLEITVAHEFNHATQAAMDATEVVGFWENTATVIETEVYPIGWPYATDMFGFFQSQPYRPLEYMNMSESDLYEYGGAIWAHFLREQYGGGQAEFLRQIWEGSVQNGYTNEPDYFDALDELLVDVGGVATATRSFAEHRFFVGQDADGEHLPDAEQWGGAEVWLSATMGASQLPIIDRGPHGDGTMPQPNGCNYAKVSTLEARLPLRISFAGYGGLAWEVRVFALRAGAPAVVHELALDTTGVGNVSVPVEGTERLVLAICHFGEAGYDPDEREWPKGDYRYSIEYDVPPPTVTAVEPAEIEQGAHGVELTVRGTDFFPGDELAVRAEGTRVLLQLLERVSANELRVRAVAAPDAPLGPRDVTVTNPGGDESTGTGLLTVVAPHETPAPLPDAEGGGCQCGVAGANGPGRALGSALGLLGLGAVGWARRRSLGRAASPAPARAPSRSRAHRRTRFAALGAACLVSLVTARAEAQPTWDAFVTSDSYPIRVHHPTSVPVATAEAVLGYAEQAWATQVEGMGFPTPTAVDENGNRVEGLYVYVDPDADYNHAQPLGENPDTSWTDCTVYVVVSTAGSSSTLPWLVAHEANHAFQMSADCAESDFAYENTTVAVSVLSFPDESLFAGYFLPTFQQNPHRGLDCTFFTSEELYYYHYGAALFGLFLEERYGDYDGTWLAALWQAAKQDGSVTSIGSSGTRIDVPNEPDLLDAVSLSLPGVTLGEALSEFARWRYFVGSRDDGAHFRDGAKWLDSEVLLDRRVQRSELPLENEAPMSEPNELGSSYVELELAGILPSDGLRVRFDGDPAVDWNADVLLVRSDRTADVRSVPLTDSHAGEVTLGELDAFERAVLVVTNLGAADHDSDQPHCSFKNPFSYGLFPVDLSVAPVVTEVEPGELERGASGYLWIYGENFDEGVVASLAGEGITIDWLDRIDATLLGLELRVDARAPLGPRALTLTNPTGRTLTMADAVAIVVPGGLVGSRLRPAGGLACSGSARPMGGGTAAGLAATAVVLLGVVIRRRPRRPDRRYEPS